MSQARLYGLVARSVRRAANGHADESLLLERLVLQAPDAQSLEADAPLDRIPLYLRNGAKLPAEE